MAKKKPTSRRGRQKGEQQHLPGTEPVKHKRIHPLALSYVRVRDARMDMTKDETEAKALLATAMQEEGLMDYVYDDVEVKLTSTLDVKVSKPKTPKAE